MKAKYIFIHAQGEIRVDTVFYTVMLGTSSEDQKILQRCQALRFLTSVYFHRYDAAVSDYLCRIAESLFPGVLLPILRLQRATLSGRQFLQLLRSKVFRPSPTPAGYAKTLCQLENSFLNKHSQLWKRS